MNDVLAFDWGTSIVGILDINTNLYTSCRSQKEMIEGARRIISSAGTIISFNGNRRDMNELAKILGFRSAQELTIRSSHIDMLEITSNIRWAPDPGTAPILGPGLLATYRHFIREDPPIPPSYLQDGYEENNWRDCYMTAALWKRWECGELAP